METLKVETLERRDIANVFPLVQLLFKHLELEQWAKHADRLIAPEGEEWRGILVARDLREVILGMLQYEQRVSLDGTPFMTASNILAYGLTQRQRVRVAVTMIEGLERVAQRCECRAVRCEILEHGDATTIDTLSALLSTSGHEPRHVTFFKRLDPDSQPQ